MPLPYWRGKLLCIVGGLQQGEHVGGGDRRHGRMGAELFVVRDEVVGSRSFHGRQNEIVFKIAMDLVEISGDRYVGGVGGNCCPLFVQAEHCLPRELFCDGRALRSNVLARFANLPFEMGSNVVVNIA